MVGVLETGHMQLLGMACHGPSVPCVCFSPLSLPFSSAKWMLVTRYFEDQWSSNPCGHIVFCHAGSQQGQLAQLKHHAAGDRLLPRDELAPLQLSWVCLHSVWHWSLCGSAAAALHWLLPESLFMCDSRDRNQMSTAFLLLFGQAVWQFSLRSFQGLRPSLLQWTHHGFHFLQWFFHVFCHVSSAGWPFWEYLKLQLLGYGGI